MSADNGVYILQTKDGWRVTHAQAIDNLYWHRVPGGSLDQFEMKEEVNLSVLYTYFKWSMVYKTKEMAWHEAMILFRKVGYVEYGLQEITGLENIEFPKQCCDKKDLTKDEFPRCNNCGEYE